MKSTWNLPGDAWHGRNPGDGGVEWKRSLEAFRASSVSHFDAVLMDMQMPEMDGCAAAMAIRNLKNERKDAETIPIIAITANAFSEDIAATEAAGMNAISPSLLIFLCCAELWNG